MKHGKRKTALNRIDGNKCGHTRTSHDIAIDTKAKHDKLMLGIETKVVCHPTLKNCWIEKIVHDEKN